LTFGLKQGVPKGAPFFVAVAMPGHPVIISTGRAQSAPPHIIGHPKEKGTDRNLRCLLQL
jgi:hypothetical protein